ncbi:MAG: aldo/keto reductase, partial [Prevotella sp.]|nr:aldo/keto reductase [Prevotella sp.]
MAEHHGKNTRQVALRCLIHQGVTVIPKSSRRERMEQNMDVFDFHL